MIHFSAFTEGEMITFKGQMATIIFISEHYKSAMIKFASGEDYKCTPQELIEAYNNHELTFLSQNMQSKIKVSNKDLKEISRREFIVNKIDKSEFPYSKMTLNKVQKEIFKEYGEDGKAKSYSTLNRYYKDWLNDGKIMATQVLRQTESRQLIVNNVEELFREFFFDVAVKEFPLASVSEKIREFRRWAEENGYGDLNKSPDQIRRYHARLHRIKVIEKVDGKSEARQQNRVACNKHESDYPLQFVEMDAMHVNVGLLNKTKDRYLGAVVIYLVLDVNSRSILGYAIEVGKRGENSGGVVHAARFAVSVKRDPSYPMCGFFVNLKFDNGTAYTANQSQDCFARIASGCYPTRVKQGDGKPHVERLIGTIRHKFLKKLASYLGKREGGKYTDKDLQSAATLSIDEFKELFAHFVVHTYHNTPHQGLNYKTPLQVWNAGIKGHPPRLPANLTDLDTLRGIRETRVLQKTKGIQINNERYNSKSLNNLRNELHGNKKTHKVTVDILFDPLDASAITVIDPRNDSRMNVRNVVNLPDDIQISFAELNANKIARSTAEQAPIFNEKAVLKKIKQAKNKTGTTVPLEDELIDLTLDQILEQRQSNKFNNVDFVGQDDIAIFEDNDDDMEAYDVE